MNPQKKELVSIWRGLLCQWSRTHLKLSKQSLLENISALKALKKLTLLELDKVNVNDISALKDLQKLKHLTLYYTKVTDLNKLSGKNIKLNALGNDLRWCSPQDRSDIIDGMSCYEKDGTLKSWWKRLLRL